MKVVDSGVVVAAFASWHEAHQPAADLVRTGPQIAAHALVEAYSVLTRLPAPHRAPAAIVAEFLGRAFPDDPLTLSAEQYRTFVTRRLVDLDISGGPTYDALIGETARTAGGAIITLDGRALTTYARLGCEAVLLSGR